ncbi:type IVB secretion system protein IcmH/DotU, partial [Serratia ureilytica]
MNEFERKIREAMAVTRNNANPRLPASGAVGKTTAEIAALSFGARALAAKLRQGESDLAQPTKSKLHEVEATENIGGRSDEYADESQQIKEKKVVSRTALSKPGVMMGHWDNPLIAAAIPVLLQVERVRDQKQLNPAAVRAQIVREIQQFQQTLLADHVAPSDVDKLAYLLCSYVDECCMGTLESGELNLSLLVEFYRDAWGGEKCFEHLQEYLTTSPRNKEILAFYDLILSLGFEGQYHVMERGAVLLADVRNRLDGYLYSQNPTQTLADAEPSSVVRKATRITPLKLLCYGLAIALLAYASAAWYLHDQSRALRNAILAWTP